MRNETRTIGYLNKLTADNRMVTLCVIRDGLVPVITPVKRNDDGETTEAEMIGTAAVYLDGDTIMADIEYDLDTATVGWPTVSFDTRLSSRRPHLRDGAIDYLEVQGTVAGVMFTDVPAWDDLRTAPVLTDVGTKPCIDVACPPMEDQKLGGDGDANGS